MQQQMLFRARHRERFEKISSAMREQKTEFEPRHDIFEVRREIVERSNELVR